LILRDLNLSVRAKTTTRRKHRSKSSWPWISQGVIDMTPKAQARKKEINLTSKLKTVEL